MSEKQIATNYGGIEIVYRESDSRWVFTLRGRERSAESLSLAKAAIDKPEPKKKSAFSPVEAWYSGYRFGGGADWRKVTITSIAESGPRYSSGGDVWIKDGKERSKVDVSGLFSVNESNNAIIEELLNLKKESEAIDARINSARSKLKVFVIPKDEESETTAT